MAAYVASSTRTYAAVQRTGGDGCMNKHYFAVGASVNNFRMMGDTRAIYETRP